MSHCGLTETRVLMTPLWPHWDTTSATTGLTVTPLVPTLASLDPTGPYWTYRTLLDPTGPEKLTTGLDWKTTTEKEQTT